MADLLRLRDREHARNSGEHPVEADDFLFQMPVSYTHLDVYKRQAEFLLGRVGEQPAGQVLRADQSGKSSARDRNQAMGEGRPRYEQRLEGDLGAKDGTAIEAHENCSQLAPQAAGREAIRRRGSRLCRYGNRREGCVWRVPGRGAIPRSRRAYRLTPDANRQN